MNELKKYFGAFALCVTFVFSLTGVIAGAITAKERAQSVIYGTDYAVLVVEGENQSSYAAEDKNDLSLDFSFLKNTDVLDKVLPFTPFGAVWYLVKEIGNKN